MPVLHKTIVGSPGVRLSPYISFIIGCQASGEYLNDHRTRRVVYTDRGFFRDVLFQRNRLRSRFPLTSSGGGLQAFHPHGKNPRCVRASFALSGAAQQLGFRTPNRVLREDNEGA